MVDEESLRRNRNATPQFIGALAELTWTQIGMFSCSSIILLVTTHSNLFPTESVAMDLESFSRHAGRTTVTTDDVLLLARRNTDLYEMIKDSVDKKKAAKSKGKAPVTARTKR